MENVNTEILSNLFQQVLFYAIISSVVIDGIKKSIKVSMGMKPEDKLHSLIGLGLMYMFGFASCFFIQSGMITNIYTRLFFGVIIGSVGVSCYEAVVKSVLELIPCITKKIFSGGK